MGLRRVILIVFSAGVFLAGGLARAQEIPARENQGPLAADWWACVEAAELVQGTIDAPDHLLTAVAFNESARRAPNGETAPWPWTINVGGQGYVFATKEQAVFAAQQLLNAGTRSFDVGCMQVNVFFHPRAFTSFEEAFDPLANMMYAADYLYQLKRQAGSWSRAVELYHSYTEEFNQIYGARFQNFWELTRRRAARGDMLVTSRPLESPALVETAEIDLLGADEETSGDVGLWQARHPHTQHVRGPAVDPWQSAGASRTPMVAALLASSHATTAASPIAVYGGADLRAAAIGRRVAHQAISETGS